MLSSPLLSPAGNLNRIRHAIEKLKFDKAHALIRKVSKKDLKNPGIGYFSALLFSINDFSSYNLDTARIILDRAIGNFDTADDRLIEKLEKDGLTSERMEELRVDIRDRMYDKVVFDISIDDLEIFMKNYPNSPFNDRLIFQRDSLVYGKVRLNDSLGVYEKFLDRYSTTQFRDLALKRMDELRYDILTQTNELGEYYNFLAGYPETRFRKSIEEFILKKGTADHLPRSYLEFIDFSEMPELKKKAGDILHYFSGEQDFSLHHPLQDSVKNVKKLRQLVLLPAMEAGKFGFHTLTGEQQIPFQYHDLHCELKRKITSDEWLAVSDSSNKIIDKRGNVIIDGADEYVDLGYGLAKVRQGVHWFLYHKGGFRIIEEPILDAEVLGGRWINVKKKGTCVLVSFSGYEITRSDFDSIEILGSFWVFEKNGLFAISTEEKIASQLVQNGIELEFKFDDLELVDENTMIGFMKDRECMLDHSLRLLIPWGAYSIKLNPTDWYVKNEREYPFDHSEQDIVHEAHPDVGINQRWLAIKTSEDWMVIPRRKEALLSREYDSLKLINDFFAFSKKGEVKELIFPGGDALPLNGKTTIQLFINQPDYILIDNGGFKTLFDKEATRLIQGTYDEIAFFNDSLLQVGTNGKSGLVKLDGSLLIKPICDAIDEESGLVLCLKKGKVGSFDLERKIWIAPNYDSRVKRIGENYLVKKYGNYGVVDPSETSILSYSYDEIQFWNDTSFLVRKDSKWSLLSYDEKGIGEGVALLSESASTAKEKIWKYVSDGKYGLISSQNGTLLNPEFTDIFNIGNENTLVFFADQHLDKAGFHVVSYIDSMGNLIVSKAYKKEEFERILCHD